MNLENIIKGIGWVFTLTPIVVFIGIGVVMIKGAMKDDELVRSLVLLAIGIFFIGVILLLLIYLTRLFT